ncbi:MAG: competence protein ComEC family protein [Opitutales bacterium]|nr:competence protein ComEC family protein [Opitutales bacterium]
MDVRQSSNRAPLLWLFLPIILGYLLAEISPWSLPPWAGLSLAALFLWFAGWHLWGSKPHWVRREKVWVLSAAMGVILTAMVWHQLQTSPPTAYTPETPPRHLSLTVQIERVFQSTSEERITGMGRIVEAPSPVTYLEGEKIYFFVFLEDEQRVADFTRTTRLRGAGLWEPLPDETEGFTAYLDRQGVQSQWRWVRQTEIVRPAWPFFREARLARDFVRETLWEGSSHDHPWGRIFNAMLLGERLVLGEEQRLAFLQTGTLHLFAISGLHIGIIALSLHCFLRILRLPRIPEVLIGLSILLFYVELTGSPPSAVRAFLMTAFFWGGRLFRQGGNPTAALANSGVVVLVLFPQQLWSAGFQLSYTVVAAILLLGIPFWQQAKRISLQHPWRRSYPQQASIFERMVDPVLSLLAISLSATLASSVLAIHYFGHFSPGAVFLNMILVPLATLVMVAGLCSISLGTLGLTVGSSLFNHAAWVVVALMEQAVRLFLAIPGFFYTAEYRWSGMVLIGWLLLIACLLIIPRRELSTHPTPLLWPFVGMGLFYFLTLRMTPI